MTTVAGMFSGLRPFGRVVDAEKPSAARSLRLVIVLEVSDLESSRGRGRAAGIFCRGLRNKGGLLSRY